MESGEGDFQDCSDESKQEKEQKKFVSHCFLMVPSQKLVASCSRQVVT
jgi:hypothetical protein